MRKFAALPLVFIFFAALSFGIHHIFSTKAAYEKRFEALNTKVENDNKAIIKLKEEGAVKESTISFLSKQIESLKGSEIYQELKLIKDTLKSYREFKEKTQKYESYGVKTAEISEKSKGVVDLILDLKLTEASNSVAAYSLELDKLYSEKKEADRKALEELKKKYESVINGTGYVRYNVQTQAGVFNADILVLDLNRVRVITDTANDSECKRDCPLKSLANFVAQNGGFAGINGSYYCPPEYPQCSEKKNSFDFPVYNSRLRKWLNKANLSWDNRALMTFSGNSANFYKFEKSFNTSTGVDAAITMVPGLLKDGQVIVGDYRLEAKETIKSTRSSIGFNGNKLFVIVARGVNNFDQAYVHKAVGSRNALALDGGGSINFYYNGSYLAGPGRLQANSLIFKYR